MASLSSKVSVDEAFCGGTVCNATINITVVEITKNTPLAVESQTIDLISAEIVRNWSDRKIQNKANTR